MNAILWVRLIHTLVFFFASSCIGYTLYRGFSGRSDRYLWGSVAIVAGIGLSYLLNGFECPLATLIQRLAGGDRSVSDIFLPAWFADKIVPVSSVVFALGLGLVIRNHLRPRL